MKFKNIITTGLLILALLSTGSAMAEDWFWGLTYEPSIPMGDAKDFADDSFSWRGVGFEGRNWLNPDLSAGFAVSWNVFHEERDWDTISEPGRDITGNQSRDINAVPIFVNAHRYWGDTYQWRPFIGMNAGTMYTERRLDMGLYSLKQSNWHFAFAPEFGGQSLSRATVAR